LTRLGSLSAAAAANGGGSGVYAKHKVNLKKLGREQKVSE